MLLRFCFIIIALNCLEMAYTLPEGKSRIARDTRDIPTNMFKPIGQSKNAARNENSTAEEDYPETYQQSSTGETHAVLGDTPEESSSNFPQRNFGRPVFNNPSTGFRNYPLNYPINQLGSDIPRSGISTSRGIFNNFPSDNYPSDNFPINPSGSRFTPPTFIGSSPIVQRNGNGFARSGPIYSGSMPLTSNHVGFSGGPGPIGGPSNNFYRSESYSFSSDGSGPPQIQQDVYDSRQGFGSSVRNF